MSQRNSTRGGVLAVLASLAATVISAGAARAVAQDPKPRSETETLTLKATIEAIDKTSRNITLKGPEGNYVVVRAGEEAKRFDQLKVGDVITATYTGSVAVRVRKPGEAAPVAEKMKVTPRQGRPGATADMEETLSVTVEEIDRTAPSISVKGPEGRVLSFRVSDVKNIEGLKAGDKVDITFKVALLLKVDPATAAP